MSNISYTDVLVVGAGPIGLSLAIQLRSQGFTRFRIIDKTDEPGEELITSISRAIGVHARTLEVLEDVGVTPSLLERGKIAHTASNYYNSKLTYRVDYPSGCDHSHVRYNWNFMVTQGNTIDVLHTHLSKKMDHKVEWNTSLVDFKDTDSGVTARIKNDVTGVEETVHAKYLIGCDGCHSRVRKGLGIDFPGKVYPVKWVVCDLDIDWDIPHDDITFLGIKNAYAIALPLAGGGEGRFRVTMGMPLTEEEKKDHYEHAQPIKGGRFDKEDCVNFFKKIYPSATVKSTPAQPQQWFQVHCRMATTLAQGNCFLVGDAAHVHSPVLGQGMNMGIQDAANLAWKLVSVCRGDSSPELLKTYKSEREHTDKEIVNFVDKVTGLVITPSRFIQYARGFVLSRILKVTPGRRKLVSKVMQLSVNYEHSNSSLFKDAWKGKGGIPAGHRVPDPVFCASTNTRLFEEIEGNKWSALVFVGTNPTEEDLEKAEQAAKKIHENYQGLVHAKLVFSSGVKSDKRSAITKISDLENSLHDVFGAKKASIYLFRPDRYVGYREVGFENCFNYLEKIYPSFMATGELLYG